MKNKAKETLSVQKISNLKDTTVYSDVMKLISDEFKCQEAIMQSPISSGFTLEIMYHTFYKIIQDHTLYEPGAVCNLLKNGFCKDGRCFVFKLTDFEKWM